MQDILMHSYARVESPAEQWWLHLLFIGLDLLSCLGNSDEVLQRSVFVKDGPAQLPPSSLTEGKT